MKILLRIFCKLKFKKGIQFKKFAIYSKASEFYTMPVPYRTVVYPTVAYRTVPLRYRVPFHEPFRTFLGTFVSRFSFFL